MPLVEVTADTSSTLPHVVLLGAGASKAALPEGDRNGRHVPVLRDLSNDLRVAELFPNDLKAIAQSDFEAAFSQLH